MAFLYGKEAAEKLQKVIKGSVECVVRDHGVSPRLAVVQVGDAPTSSLYIKQLKKGCDATDIMMTHIKLACENGTTAAVALDDVIDKLNRDSSVHGILLLRPLPKNFFGTYNEYVNKIITAKDVEHVTEKPIAKTNAYTGNHVMTICPPVVTGLGFLADYGKIQFEYSHCVIIGRGGTVARPLAAYLISQDATVTICHNKTFDLTGITRSADIIFSATGYRDLVKPDMVKDGTVVFDIGMTIDDRGVIHGDVHPDVVDVASTVIPNPGGVGPMTVAMVMQNTLNAARYLLYK